jgi:hypothetical protein
VLAEELLDAAYDVSGGVDVGLVMKLASILTLSVS